MVDLVYNRTASVYRASVVSDSNDGARMVPTAIITNMTCSINPGRDRHVPSAGQPSGIPTLSTNEMTSWTLLCRPPVRIMKGDTVVDDLGRQYIVGPVDETAFGAQIILTTVSP